MKIRTIIMVVLLGSAISSCVDEPISYTTHPDDAKITLVTDWSQCTEGVSIPAEYTVRVNEAEVKISGTANSLPNLFKQGDYFLQVFNAAEKIGINKDIVTVATAGNIVAADPGWLFTADTLVTLESDKEYDISLAMRQQIRQLDIQLVIKEGDPDDVASITASLSGIANSMDIKTETYTGTELSVTPVFARNNDKLTASVRLLGLTGEDKKLTLDIVYKGGAEQHVVSDIGNVLADFNTDKYKPITLRGDTRIFSKVGFNTTITGWETQDTINGDAEEQ